MNKLSTTLSVQVEEFSKRQKHEKAMHADWKADGKAKPTPSPNGKLKRLSKVNETSAQNVLVEQVSPGADIKSTKAHKCTFCAKKY